jgi:hypothetical protein
MKNENSQLPSNALVARSLQRFQPMTITFVPVRDETFDKLRTNGDF